MEKFVFKGDWETHISLEVIANLLSNPKFAFRRTALNPSEYRLQIDDVFDLDPDPSRDQLNTIAYLQSASNQQAILKTIYEYLKKTVYPQYKEYIPAEDYPTALPMLNGLDDLAKVIGLDHVVVLRFGKNAHAYYNLMFETSLDEEHGLGFVLHQGEIIEHGEIGGMMYEQVAAHMGMTDKEYSDFQSKIQTPTASTFQIASDKYGKLKPWQIDFNRSYHFYLYRNGSESELIDFIESGHLSIDQAFRNLRMLMVKENRVGLIEYFITKGYK